MGSSRGRRIVDGDVFRRLVQARDYIESRYNRPLVLDEMAAQAGISPFHFLRLFTRAFDETPGEFVRRLRLERAKERLARGARVTDTCFDVGYSSVGSFSLLFSRRFGRPPSEWRRSARSLVAVPGAFARLYVPCCFLLGWGAGSQSPRSAPRSFA